MRLFILSLFLCLLLGDTYGQVLQYKTIKSLHQAPVCEIPVTDEINHHYVPYNYVDRGIKVRNTVVNVQYGTTVPSSAKTAMDEVVRIISELFPTDIPINIFLIFDDDLGEGTLASAGTIGWLENFPNAPKLNTLYPWALAEKLSQTEINAPGDPDLFIFVNAEQNWYYDFSNPGAIGTRFDFVSVILHEVLHGLGFAARTNVEEGNGFIFFPQENLFSAFTDFIYDGSGMKLTDFSEGSMELGSSLTGNNVVYRLESSTDQYKLFAPAVFNRGSSISHLDETTYNNTDNSLMTPTIFRGEIERGFGGALDMMYDLGWNHTYILHELPEPTVEKPIDEDFVVNVSVESDSEIKEGSLTLFYSFDGFVSENQEIQMELMEGNNYRATIPAPGIEEIVDYYFTVEDTRNKLFSQPGIDVLFNRNSTYRYTFGPDRVPPFISHVPVETVSNQDIGFNVEARVIDEFTGVDTVMVEWRLNGADQPEAGLSLDKDNLFEDDLYMGRVEFGRKLDVDDVLEYRVLALDKGSIPNTGRTLRGGRYYQVSIVPSLEPVLTYSNDFDTPSEDFEGDFSITTPFGFANPCLNSPHPYEIAGEGNVRDYISNLQVPIIVDNEFPIIEFDEIVLVEPGEPNVPFGQDEFWDYVIVEAKAFGGSGWKPLLDGYDSRARSNWLSLYNSNISNQNSNASGNPSLFATRTIDITASGDFKPGDIVEIRFRLFSDPFARGWGWAIDNLTIQELAVSTKDVELDQELSVFPNPVMGNQLYINTGRNEELLGQIYSLDGKQLTSFNLVKNNSAIDFPFAPGTYILQVVSSEGIATRKFVKL